jgi:SAM-dependent methyltransferase
MMLGDTVPIIAIPGIKRSSQPSQCQKPRGWIGRLFLRSMNRRHARVTNWGLQHVTIRENDTILDVGCGGGVTVAKLAMAAPKGKISGIDHSADSVAAARETNRSLTAQGRVTIELASVSALPYSDNVFDLVTAVETHFWWGEIAAGMREIFRVLKPGGHLIMIAEFYNGPKYAKYADRIRKFTSMAVLDVEQHCALFADAGFTDVDVTEDASAGWLSVVGTKRSH